MIKKILFLFFLILTNYAFAEDQKLTVMLDWQINPDHASLWIAQNKGFFHHHGLEVELIVPSNPNDPSRFAAAGKVDLGLTYEPGWILQKAQDIPLVWFATIVAQPLACIITKPMITSLKQLENKQVGYTGGALESIMLRSMMWHVNANPSGIQWINVHYDTLQAFAANRVDALTGMMRNVEPIALQSKNIPFHIFLPENYGFPSYAEMILVGNPHLQHDPRIKAFLSALKEATVYIKTHPEASWQSFANGNPALNNEANHRMWQKTIPYFDNTPEIFDNIQYQRIEKFLLNTLQK